MTVTATGSNGSNGAHATAKFDVAVIGAGVAGLYQLFRLREQGLSVRAIDAGSSFGGAVLCRRHAVRRHRPACRSRVMWRRSRADST